MQEHYLVIVGKREESKVLGCVWICLGENLERKRERICFFLLQNEGFGSIYSRNLTLRLLTALKWLLATTASHIRATGHLC